MIHLLSTYVQYLLKEINISCVHTLIKVDVLCHQEKKCFQISEQANWLAHFLYIGTYICTYEHKQMQWICLPACLLNNHKNSDEWKKKFSFFCRSRLKKIAPFLFGTCVSKKRWHCRATWRFDWLLNFGQFLHHFTHCRKKHKSLKLFRKFTICKLLVQIISFMCDSM
jgi:hypothetical protein